LSGISEVSLPEDVTLVAERVGEELIAAASVRRPILEPVSEPESLNAADKEESSVAAAPRPHKDAGDASPKANQELRRATNEWRACTSARSTMI